MTVLQYLVESVRFVPYVALCVALFALFAKWQEKPRLRVVLPKDNHVMGQDAQSAWRFVHVAVENPRLNPIVARLTYRQAAQDTRLQLEYSASDGSLPKFGFDGRWSGNPEPVQMRVVNGQLQLVFDPWLVHTGRFKAIVSGAGWEAVALAVKVQGDDDCYGFTNESYQIDPSNDKDHWRLSKYRLPKGTYRVTATAVSGEVRSKPEVFVLHNDGPDRTDLWLDIPRRG